METESSLPYSQVPATCPCREILVLSLYHPSVDLWSLDIYLFQCTLNILIAMFSYGCYFWDATPFLLIPSFWKKWNIGLNQSSENKCRCLPVPTALTCQKASVLLNTTESSVANFDALRVKSYYYLSALLFENRCLVQYNPLLVRLLTVYRQDQKPIDQKFSRLSGNPNTEF
jgi:hypothetical protein